MGRFSRQCVSVVLVTALLAKPAWARPVAPQLSSKPGAAYTLFLDFSGFTWVSSSDPVDDVTPAYNSDGDSATFSGTEMLQLHEIWSRVSESFATFDVNVTMVDPASPGQSDYDRQVFYAAQPRLMHTVIGGRSPGFTGTSPLGTAQTTWTAAYADKKINWVFPEGSLNYRMGYVAATIAHENGHALGLNHQSDWDIGYIKRAEYSNGSTGTAGTYGPIMGSTTSGFGRGLWSRGTDAYGSEANDVGTLLTYNSIGVGFSVLDDGVGHTQGTATPIKAIGGTIDYTSSKGLITTAPGGSAPDPTNAAHYTKDYWSFTTTGGNVTLNAISGRSTMNPGVADPGKTLDAKLTLYNSSWNQVATTSYGASLDATITQNLPAGTYYAMVTPTLGPNGTGEVDADFSMVRHFFDVGSYFLTGSIPGLNSETVRYWDNASGNGFGAAGGTWQASTSNQWNTDSTGNAGRGSNVSIATLDAVHFGTDSLGLAAGTVDVSGNVSANRISFGAASGPITLSGGTITLASIAPTVTVNNTTSTIASVLAGNAGITKAGTGTLVLAGANTLTGATTINGGTLQLTGNGNLSDMSAVNTSASGTSIDISGITAASKSVGSIAGASGSTIVLGAKNLTVQGTTANTTYAGVISGVGGSLTKYGAETLTLTGSNTYTGGTNIAGGTLSFSNVGLVNTGGNITFTGPGRLQWSGHSQDLSSRIVMTNGATATIDTNGNNVTFASGIGSSSNGSFTKSGAGVLTLAMPSTYNGTTTVSGGVLQLNHANALPGGIGATGGTSFLFFAGGVLGLGAGDFTRDLGETPSGVSFTYNAGLSANSGGWAAYGADRNVNLNNDGHSIYWWSTFRASSLILGASTATHKVTFQNGLNLANVQGTIQVDDGAAPIDAELSGVISGVANGNLFKTGTGTLAVTNSNTYTGVTNVSGGTLDVSLIANGGQNSSIGAAASSAGNLVFSNGTTFRYSGAANATTDRAFAINGHISPTGATVESSGVGTLSFTNPATTLGFGLAGIVRTLTLGGTNTGANTFGKVFSNNGGGATHLVKAGAGQWVLNQVNTYTGTTTVSGGSLVIDGAGSINSSSAINVSAGARLVYNSSTPLTRAPTLAGSAANPAILFGSGTIGVALALDNLGDVLSPGNSPGVQSFGVNQTWNSFTYAWEVNDWNSAVEGATFDGIDIAGGLTLSGSSYGLDLFSLTSLNASGNLSNFSESSRSWTILSTTSGISGFLASEWSIDAGGFTAGSMPAGSWSLALGNGGNDLLLSYSPVPEPGTLVLLIAGFAAALALRRRVRNSSKDALDRVGFPIPGDTRV